MEAAKTTAARAAVSVSARLYYYTENPGARQYQQNQPFLSTNVDTGWRALIAVFL